MRSQLRPALDQGLLTVVNLGEGMDSVLRSAMGQSHEGFADSLELWIRAVERRMTDPRSRLLFDGESADFFKMAIEEGEIALSRPSIFRVPGLRRSVPVSWRGCRPFHRLGWTSFSTYAAT